MNVCIYTERREENTELKLTGFEPVRLVTKNGKLTRFGHECSMMLSQSVYNDGC